MRVKFWCTEHNVPLAGVPFFDQEKGQPGVRSIYTATMWCPNGDVKDQACSSNWWVGSYDEPERRREVDGPMPTWARGYDKTGP